MSNQKNLKSNDEMETWHQVRSIIFSVWGLLGFAFVVMVMGYMIFQYPRIEISYFPDLLPKEQADLENKFRDTILKLFSGLFFFITASLTAFLTYRNVKTSESNAKAAEAKQITERFGKAIEQLGSKQITVQLGAIYSLERIAKDSSADHWTVMKILTSFIQENSPIIEKQQREHNPKINNVIQAALRVIGDSKIENDSKDQRLDLSGTNLNQANLKQANLSRANLEGANLWNAVLIKTNLSTANLEGVDLRYADLSDAVLSGAKLEDADLSNAILVKANLKEANLKGATLWATELIEVNLSNADLGGAKLFLAKLIGADLQDANLIEADLRGADLEKAQLAGSELSIRAPYSEKIFRADFTDAKNLSVDQIKLANNWENAKYNEAFCEELGLPPEST